MKLIALPNIKIKNINGTRNIKPPRTVVITKLMMGLLFMMNYLLVYKTNKSYFSSRQKTPMSPHVPKIENDGCPDLFMSPHVPKIENDGCPDLFADLF